MLREKQPTAGESCLPWPLTSEKYDFRPQAKSLIRATEGTIPERIPPRVQIREGAELEALHIMMFIDDQENAVIGSASQHKKDFTPLYDFELMFIPGG